MTNDERFTNAILNFCSGKSYEERMEWICYFLDTIGNLEAAAATGPSYVAHLLFDTSKQIQEHVQKVLNERNYLSSK